MSNAGTPVSPSAAATVGAVAGTGRSGVEVASTTASTERSGPADRSAAAPASAARSEVGRPAAVCLVWIPVRLTIQSSEVFRRAARSWLLTTVDGTCAPTPATTAERAPTRCDAADLFHMQRESDVTRSWFPCGSFYAL